MKLAARLFGTVVAAAIVWGAPSDAAAQAQMGRVSVRVVDPDDEPLADVTITVTSPDVTSLKIVKTTSKKGKALIAISDVNLNYQIRFEKAGYETVTEPLKAVAGGTMDMTQVLPPAGAAAGPAEGVPGSDIGGGSRAVRTFNEGVEAQQLGDYDAAEAKYREAAELDPELAAAHTALAALASIREDWTTAAAEAEAALAIDPGDVRAMQIRFDAYRLGGDEAKAAEAAEALRAIGDLGDAAARIFNEGVEAFNAGDSAGAISKFQQVVQLDPTNATAYVALAQVSLNQGAPAEAHAMAKKALELDPDDIRALKLAFDGARLSGDSEAAGAALDRLVELDPEWLKTTVFDHATQLFNSNQAAEAAFELEYVVKAYPELARAHFMLGMALFNTGRVEEGRTHLETFIGLAPDDPDVEIARGLLSYQE